MVRAHVTKAQRGLGTATHHSFLLPCWLDNNHSCQATIILKGGFRWSRCSKASLSQPLPSVTHKPNHNHPRATAYVAVPRGSKSLPGTTLLDSPLCAQQIPLSLMKVSYLSAAKSGNGFPVLPGSRAEPDSTQRQAFEMCNSHHPTHLGTKSSAA